MELQLAKIFLLIAYAVVACNANYDRSLWCYQCNTDSKLPHRNECNDPYLPAPTADLIECPRNDTYVCLKSLIFYKNVHVTVRGCVLKREKSTYCSFKEAYPDASLQCLFCADNACNASRETTTSITHRYIIILSFIIFVAFSEILGPLTLIT